MKTTIKLGAARSIIVTPAPNGVRVDLTMAGVVIGGDNITEDQAGALMFGIEQALEKSRIERERAHGITDIPY